MLQERARERQRKARAAGTNRNRRSAVSLYLAFCLRMNVDPYTAQYQDLCGFIEYLRENENSPATIRNKFAHIRAHLSLVGTINAQVFHTRVTRALDACDRDKTHVPNVKDPIDPNVFAQVLLNIPFDKIGTVIRASLLCLYYGALRQSELLPKTTGMWDPSTQPTRGDCVLTLDKCTINIKKAKNMQLSGQGRHVQLLRAHNSHFCPVRAMFNLFLDTPTLAPGDPLIMFPDNRTPVPCSFIIAQLHKILIDLGYSNLVAKISLHSLRKSAATNAFADGCPELTIRNFGGWSSDAYKTYIQTQNDQVSSSLISVIDKQK